MSKRMILFENCGDCPNSCMRFLIPEDRICSKMFTKEGERVCPEEGTPDWCPLPVAPEKIAVEEGDYQSPLECFNYGMKTGWNACIDVITRDEEE